MAFRRRDTEAIYAPNHKSYESSYRILIVVLAVNRPRSFTRANVARGSVIRASSNNTFDDDWLKAEVPVHLLTLFGWTIPSASPCPAFENNNSLFYMLCTSVSENLSHFPTGPALDDKFWLYMITWHIGLFVTMLLGQIGYQGRKQGYF